MTSYLRNDKSWVAWGNEALHTPSSREAAKTDQIPLQSATRSNFSSARAGDGVDLFDIMLNVGLSSRSPLHHPRTYNA